MPASYTREGGAGIDTVTLTLLARHAGNATSVRADYGLERVGGQWQTTRLTDGAMLSLQNVERLQFADGSLALDVDCHAGQAVRLRDC